MMLLNLSTNTEQNFYTNFVSTSKVTILELKLFILQDWPKTQISIVFTVYLDAYGLDSAI